MHNTSTLKVGELNGMITLERLSESGHTQKYILLLHEKVKDQKEGIWEQTHKQLADEVKNNH